MRRYHGVEVQRRKREGDLNCYKGTFISHVRHIDHLPEAFRDSLAMPIHNKIWLV